VLRYYFDEHMKPAIARQLRKRGIDVLTTQEAGRANQGIDDPDQLAFATSLGRVLVTQELRNLVRLLVTSSTQELLFYTSKPALAIISTFLKLLLTFTSRSICATGSNIIIGDTFTSHTNPMFLWLLLRLPYLFPSQRSLKQPNFSFRSSNHEHPSRHND
jgi:hypothetical protein